MAKNHAPCELTIKETARLIKSGKLTSVDLVKSCLERIDTLDGRIKAWTFVDREGALARAAALDAELRAGKRRGPLHGIPVGIKDIFFTAGLPTEAGSKSWAGFVPDYDAASVARLKEAGAIILGKTHTTEFAFMDPAPTCNPYNTQHTPGGSSSGSGAAVAARMCFAALGSQTGGSTLRPAAFNGIVGLKAEHGRISAYGVVPLSWSMDHVGILTRSVEDAALLLQVLSGYDERDPYSLNAPVPNFIVSRKNTTPPHLGLAKGFFFDNTDEEMRRATEAAAQKLREAGAKIEEVAVPASIASSTYLNHMIMKVEAAAYHKDLFARRKELYGTNIRGLIEEGMTAPATGYAAALKASREMRIDIESFFQEFDALLTPGAPAKPLSACPRPETP